MAFLGDLELKLDSLSLICEFGDTYDFGLVQDVLLFIDKPLNLDRLVNLFFLIEKLGHIDSLLSLLFRIIFRI